jgi:hypothetical protein
MKTHLLLGFLIGAAINLSFQYTDTTSRLDILELAVCATMAALAALTAALVQRATLSGPHHGLKSLVKSVKLVPRRHAKPHN